MLKKKLAFVGNSSFTMYNFRIGLFKALVQSGYDVTVIAPKDNDVSLYEIENIHYIPITIDCRGMNPLRDIQLIFQLNKIFQFEKFDFIFFYTIKPVIYGCIAARISKIHHISVITGLGYTFMHAGFINRITVALYKFALKKVKEVWFLNADDRFVFSQKGITKKKKTYLLNGEGVDTQAFFPHEKKKEYFSFIFIARVLWDKGIGEYVAATRKLKEKHPKIRFQILGPLGAENPAAVKPEDMEQWVNEGVIDYLGETTKVASYIANSDCVVLPSYREGLSRILLEAAAMERPIIASNVTGCKEIVEDGVSGYLCLPKDSESLMDCMEKMYLLSDEERAAMGKRGREIVLEKFDEKNIINKYQKKLAEYLK